MKSRVEHIDIAKGMTITCVALFHSKVTPFIPEIIDAMSLFRMPLFFFLSGVFFSAGVAPKTFFQKKSEALLKPYFFILLLVFCINVLLGRQGLWWQFKGIFYGNGDTIQWIPLWFLTHLFALYCFSYMLINYSFFKECTDTGKWITLALFLVIGIINVDMFWYKNTSIFHFPFKKPGLPFSIDILFITSFFFLAGTMLKKKAIQFIPNMYIFSLTTFAFLCITAFTDANINLNKRMYIAPFYATIGAFCGIYMALTLSYFLTYFDKIKKLLLMLGGSSLYILIFHGHIGGKTYLVLSNHFPAAKGSLGLALFTFALSVGLPLLIKELILSNGFLSLFFKPIRTNSWIRQYRQMEVGVPVK